MTHLLSAANASMEKLRAARVRHRDADLGVKSDVKSVSIVTMNGKKPQVQLETLARILHGYEHRPVVIISVFGDYRGGKSFLLNLLCQYLMQKQSDDWYKKKVKLVKVFHWKSGVEKDTSGIDITEKPFILENDKGEKIAVFLMDTQGSFDREMTVAEGSMIFAMSTLLSSVQIYNMQSGLIRENDLQNLGQFLHHANTTAGGDATSAPLLPHLKFLFRNWQNKADYEVGSKGGAKYLQKFLETNEKENKDVREKIIQGFTDVTCHLLPYPGEKLTEQRDSHDSSLKLSGTRIMLYFFYN
ncbi:atlastin-1-like [Ciona intestinalis]